MLKMNVTALLSLSLTLAACGGGSSGLTDEQKTLVKKTNSSAFAATQVSKNRRNRTLTRSVGEFTTNLPFPSDEVNPPTSPSSSSDESINYAPMEEALENCQFNFEAPQPPNAPSEDGSYNPGPGRGRRAFASLAPTFAPTSQDLEMTIDGEGCPITMKYDLSMKQNMQNGAGSFGMNFAYTYAALTEDFKKLNDVDSTRMTMSMNVTGNQQSAKMTLNGNGLIHSQQIGDVKMTASGVLNASQASQNGSFTISYEFPDFTAVIEMAQGSDGQVIYSLNGEEMTQQEIQAYISGLPVGQNGQNGQSSDKDISHEERGSSYPGEDYPNDEGGESPYGKTLAQPEFPWVPWPGAGLPPR